MSLIKTPKRYHFPISIISQAVWLYHRFNHSFRDVQEQLAFRAKKWTPKIGQVIKDKFE